MDILKTLSTESLVTFIIGVGAGLAVYGMLNVVRRSCTCKDDGYYETTTQANEYLCLHFANKHDFDFPDLLPVNGLEFPLRCAEVCLEFCSQRGRALDVGCAVGRSSFELARGFEDVLAIDYSQSFVDIGNQLVTDGEMEYVITEEGMSGRKVTARVDSDIDRDRVKFMKGDACNLPGSIGKFDCVLAANLICRYYYEYTYIILSYILWPTTPKSRILNGKSSNSYFLTHVSSNLYFARLKHIPVYASDQIVIVSPN